MSKNKLKKLDDLIRKKYSTKLLNTLSTDKNELDTLEKDFTDDMSHFDVNKEESTKLFKSLKNTHL